MNGAIKMMVAASAAIVLGQPAVAATPPQPTIVYQAGNYALPTWTTAKVFENFESGLTSKPYELALGDVSVARDPYTGNHYLDIGSGGSYSITFAMPEQVLSFAFASLSSFDQLTLHYANGTSTTFPGLALLGLTSGDPTAQWGRVSFDLRGKAGITSAVFANTGDCNGFLVDAIAAAAPEPATWALMILGFAITGMALRQRRVQPTTAARTTFG